LRPPGTREAAGTPAESVVVVTFNSAEVVGRCLTAIEKALASHTSELLVVDNRSADETLDIVRESAPGATVIQMEENVGFAAANNAALERARGRVWALVNSDAFPDAGSIDRLAQAADRNPDTGIVGGVLRDGDGRPQPSAGCFPTLARNLAVALMLHRIPPLSRIPTSVFADPALYRRARPVDWVSGAFCLARPQVGPLPAEGFMYGEDVEWARRASDAGLAVWLEPAATAVHLGGGGQVSAAGARARQAHRVSFERRWFGRRGRPFVLGSRLVLTAHALVRIAIFTALRPFHRARSEQGVAEFRSLLRATWTGRSGHEA
jgi:GT2 family glycosyltransferase